MASKNVSISKSSLLDGLISAFTRVLGDIDIFVKQQQTKRNETMIRFRRLRRFFQANNDFTKAKDLNASLLEAMELVKVRLEFCIGVRLSPYYTAELIF